MVGGNSDPFCNAKSKNVHVKTKLTLSILFHDYSNLAFQLSTRSDSFDFLVDDERVAAVVHLHQCGCASINTYRAKSSGISPNTKPMVKKAPFVLIFRPFFSPKHKITFIAR